MLYLINSFEKADMKFRNIKINVFVRMLAFTLVLFGAQSMNGAVASGFSAIPTEDAADAYDEGRKQAGERARAKRAQKKREALKNVDIPPGPGSWNFRKTAKPFIGEIPYPVAQKTQSSETQSAVSFPIIFANSFMVEPRGVGSALESALRRREYLSSVATVTRDNGFGEEFQQYLNEIAELDERIWYLKSEEAANEIASGNGWKASQMLSFAYGADIQIMIHPPNESGKTVTTWHNGQDSVYVVSRNQVIAELRRHFSDPQ